MTRPATLVLIESFRVEALQSLLSDGPGPRLSIYLPTHRRHPEWKQDSVRYHALLHRAKELLTTRYQDRDVEAFLEPLRLLEEEPHWEHSLDGLAIFRSETSMAVYRLPMPVPEIVVVADTFHTKPLLRFLSSNGRYLVLSVSQNEVALHEGSPYGAGPVNLHGVPKSFRDAIGVPDFDRTFESSYLRGAVFHGRGPGKELKKEELLRFFNAIDHGLHDYLRDEHVPLLLAAVDYYHPIYKQANRYPGLLDEGLVGNYERASADKIHADAWPIVSRVFDARRNAWIDRFRERQGTGLASDGLEEIARAAVAGRVQCLFVAEEESVWGVLDRKTGSIEKREAQRGTEDADVLDDVAEEAFKRGAEVYVLPRASMPGPGPIAAIYRF
jgi:release factor family 3